MMIFSAKLTKAKLLTIALICSCLALLIIVSVPTGTGDTVPTMKTTYNASTNEERVSFLKNFGWELNENPAEVVEVVIPNTFDSMYEAYNDLQKTQGMDLESYKGMKATRYTYTVNNYPKAKTGETVQANLLVIKNEIVAGDITSTSLGGFMQGLAKPSVNISDVADDKPVVVDGETGK